MLLTDLQKRILSAMPRLEYIRLRCLAEKLGMSSNQVRIQVRKLEAIGYLTVERPEYSTAPIRIRLVKLPAGARQDLDKLLISTKWV